MIQLHYGSRQRFERRHSDINILGQLQAPLPALTSSYRLNGADAVHFYIEPVEANSDPLIYPHGLRTPGCHRLRHRPGEFNIEIPADCPHLIRGWNEIEISAVDAAQAPHSCSARIHWNPATPRLPIHLQNMMGVPSVQDIGQVVNGLFEVDYTHNVIRSVNPVGSDALFLLGPPARSQEALYSVKFAALNGVWMGTSDFFAGHVAESPTLGIKPGYSTNGLATLDRRGGARSWIAWGDNLSDNANSWVVTTKQGAIHYPISPGVTYRVRHQVRMRRSEVMTRFKIWPIQETEPHNWLCGVSTAQVPSDLPRNEVSSFGLFQYFGSPAEWSDIHLYELDDL